MNFGNNLYQWFLSNAQSLVLMAIVVIGIYLGLILGVGIPLRNKAIKKRRENMKEKGNEEK